MQLAEKKPITADWGFLGLFVLYVGIFVGMAEIGQGSMLALREVTASIISALWGFLSVPIVRSGTQLTFAGFPMEIVLECTALHYMIIFVAGVLAFRSHSLFYRASGIIIGTLAISLMNILRIGVIGFIGRYFSSLFTFVHDYLWQGFFALFVLLLWIIWVNGKRVFSGRPFFHFLLISASASLSFWLMVTFLETYISLLAVFSNVMFRMISLFADVPQHVVAEGRLIGYVVGDEVIYSTTMLYVLNAALLLPIASITFVRSQVKLLLKRLAAATIILDLQHMLLIALDWRLSISTGPDIQSVIIWCIVMSTFIAPIVSWLCSSLIFRTERQQ
ncbi:MAG: archaeosortase/exosortase family protein [Nitrospirae bacterium]|nr:archaeosortase/exosortase family protein [Nitrospirota bacterium]